MNSKIESDTVKNRKLQLTDFKDLFSALFKINDKAVQHRVLAAINGIVDPSSCVCGSNKNKATSCNSISTQTDTSGNSISTQTERRNNIKLNQNLEIQIIPHSQESSSLHSQVSATQVEPKIGLIVDLKNIKMEKLNKQPKEHSHEELKIQNKSNMPLIIDESMFKRPINTDLNDSVDKGEEIPSRKRRKRVKKIPCVEKSIPIDAKTSSHLLFKNSPTNLKTTDRLLEEIILNREINNLDVNEISNFETILSEQSPVIINGGEVDRDAIVEKMKVEWITSTQIINSEYGYLPIHQAIKTNDVKKLMRQLFVFEYKKINILDLQTQGESNDDPIQLAIKNNSILRIFNKLFESMRDKTECFKSIDNNQNTLLHLCILNVDFDVASFKLLLCNLNHESIFQHQNDDGLTVLHLAALHRKSLMLHLMLIKIDQLLKLISNEDYESLCQLQESELNDYYSDKSKALSLANISKSDETKLNETKFKIMNSIELKSGRNALFFSLQTKNELLSLMLLVNFCDPTKVDYSGSNSMEVNDVGNVLITRVVQHVDIFLNKWKATNLIKKN